MYLLRRVDNDWFLGEVVSGETGLVPANRLGMWGSAPKSRLVLERGWEGQGAILLFVARVEIFTLDTCRACMHVSCAVHFFLPTSCHVLPAMGFIIPLLALQTYEFRCQKARWLAPRPVSQQQVCFVPITFVHATVDRTFLTMHAFMPRSRRTATCRGERGVAWRRER